MKYYSGDGVGKTFVIELDRGEELFESVESILGKEGAGMHSLQVLWVV